MGEVPSDEELRAAYCWEADDQIPRRPAMTRFRRATRYHQATWREANGHPIGTQPMGPRPDGAPARPVGSRLPLDYARQTGANLLTAGALAAALARTSVIEPHQSFDHQRLWAELLSFRLADGDFGTAVEWLGAVLLAGTLPDEMSYTPDAALAAKKAAAVNGAAVLVKPFTVAQVRRAAKAVGLLPQKSTYFYPKIATGLAFRPLAP